MNSKSSRREELFVSDKTGFDRIDAATWDKAEAYAAAYMNFLDAGKTERCCVETATEQARKRGFSEFRRGQSYKPGDKVYFSHWGKSMALAVIGRQPLSAGLRIMAAHVDVPRIDLKANPVYEDSGLALLRTHYYGGIRKYQWMALPLELRGVVCKTDGTTVRLSIGSAPGDPVFVITDLLPHLAGDQGKKSLGEAFSGEALNILFGSRPDPEEGPDRVRLAVLDQIFKLYGIREEDFASAEISAVPLQNAREVGLDRSLIGAYGHDDRGCSYAGLHAILETENPEHTAVCILADKEEIGSEGVTGMQSAFLDDFFEELCTAQKVPLRTCYAHSFCLSGDVTVGFDPNYADVYEKRNTAFLNRGVGICKYTGSGGKSRASDASAETVARVRRLFDENGVLFQMAELGKVDQGGGGTVAAYFARRNIEVLDAGFPVLAMHAPFEIASKLDLYMMYRACAALFGEK